MCIMKKCNHLFMCQNYHIDIYQHPLPTIQKHQLLIIPITTLKQQQFLLTMSQAFHQIAFIPNLLMVMHQHSVPTIIMILMAGYLKTMTQVVLISRHFCLIF